MPPPDIRTVTAVLRSEARMWDDQSEALGKLHLAVEGLRISGIEAGMFQIVISAHDRAVEQISQRCLEGKQRTHEIATALLKNANAYDRNEQETKDHVEKAY